MYSYKLNVMIVWMELWNAHPPAIDEYRQDGAQAVGRTEQTQPNPNGFGTVGTTV